MARLILSLALLLSAGEWVTCQNDSIRPEVEQREIITQDALLQRLRNLETKTNALEVENAKFLEHQNKMQSKLDALEVENANLINSVAALEMKVAAFEQKSAETETRKLLTKTKAVDGMPTNCLELSLLNHTLNGFYQVQGIGDNANKIETVYCDFQQPISSIEKRIGYIGHKSSPVYFYVQKNASFSQHNAVVPFELEILNVGGAMDLASGTFTAPVNGIYHFAFSGLKNEVGSIVIRLRVNGDIIGRAASGVHNTFVTLSSHSTLRLRTGDRVDLFTSYADGGTLFDDLGHYTHFSGWLLEEDLSF